MTTFSEQKGKRPSGKVDFSIVVPIRNEEKHIARSLQALVSLDYPQEKIEIVVVDGCSTDGTTAIVRKWAERYPNIRVLKNPNRLSSSARNIGVSKSSAEVVVFIEGHCFVHKNFLKAAMDYLQRTGAGCLGRPVTLSSDEHKKTSAAICLARSSRIGHSLTSHVYRNGYEGYVDPTSVATIYMRWVFDKVGLFDEAFDACEDLEFNHRVKKAGITCFLGSRMRADYVSRTTFQGLFQQLNRYGYGRFKCMLKHPKTISLNILIPPMFVLLWLSVPITYFAISSLHKLALFALGMYWFLIAVFSGWLSVSKRKVNFFLLIISFFIIHFALGFGFLRALAFSLFGRCPANRNSSLELS